MFAKQRKHEWHRYEGINMVSQCIVHVQITAELKLYWVL